MSTTIAGAVQDFEQFVDGIHGYAIFLLDREGRVATWNSGAELIEGYRREEIIGVPSEVFYTTEDRATGTPERMLSVAREGGRAEDEGWRVRKDGSRFWAAVVINPVHDHGSLVGYCEITVDLTQRRNAAEALRQSEERFRLLVQSVKDYAIFLLDPAGHVATWNAGAARIEGYSADDVLGRHVSMFYDPDTASAWRGELATALDYGRFEGEGWCVRRDCTRFWANVVITPVFAGDSRHVGFVQITRDLTEQRKLEAERLRVAHYEEGLRLRDEFLSIAAHELRTPLTALELQLETLRPLVDDDPKVTAKLRRVSRNADRLRDLIDTLLDVARISTGRLTLAPAEVELATIVREVVDQLHEPAAKAGCAIEVHCEAGLAGTWDRLRVGQVLSNILTNAFKYARHSAIEIGGTREADCAKLTVRDHGPGIPPGMLDAIFERFERAAPGRHYGGMGLGLYVAREIVLAHGGTIEATQPLGGGACFVVRLPLRGS
jgi:PAS domain S-box-containing protein